MHHNYARGYQTLDNCAEVFYLTSQLLQRERCGGVRIDDPAICDKISVGPCSDIAGRKHRLLKPQQ